MYQPAEDSFLLEKWVKKLVKGAVLDMGTGSGIQAFAAAKKAKKVVAVDIDKEAVEIVKKCGIDARFGNLFEPIKQNEKFDFIVFNAPYLPAGNHEAENTIVGGKNGWELIAKFLKDAKKYLRDNGKVLLVFSSLTNEKKVLSIAKKEGYFYKLLDKKHIFFEDIFLYMLKYVKFL